MVELMAVAVVVHMAALVAVAVDILVDTMAVVSKPIAVGMLVAEQKLLRGVVVRGVVVRDGIR